MLNIKEPGPLMKEYASCYGCEAKDVLQWVLDYVNGPWPDGMKVEDSEGERLESIKGYIEAMVNDSLSRKIKREMKEQKCAA